MIVLSKDIHAYSSPTRIGHSTLIALLSHMKAVSLYENKYINVLNRKHIYRCSLVSICSKLHVLPHVCWSMMLLAIHNSQANYKNETSQPTSKSINFNMLIPSTDMNIKPQAWTTINSYLLGNLILRYA